MIIANLDEMFGNGFDVEYEYKGHHWLNENLNCGCTIAICLDVDPSAEDIKFVSKQLNKTASLQTLIKETIESSDTEISKRHDEFVLELEKTQGILSDFIIDKRKKYNLPSGADFNTEYFFIKIKKGIDCKN